MDSEPQLSESKNVLSLNPAFVQIDSSETHTLLDLARAGDAEAFGEICRSYETRLFRQAVTLCRNATLAEDLAQDTLVEAWKHLRRYNGRCQFFTWLCAILLNRYRNTLRDNRAFSPLPVNEQESSIPQFAADDSSPAEAAQIREQAALVLSCIESLPPKHQQVVYLRFYVDHSLDAIAAALGCSVGTVKSRLFRALDKLRTMNALRSANLETNGGNL